MSGFLGLEAPGAHAAVQNMILYPFINPVSEILMRNRVAAGVELDTDHFGRRRYADLEDHAQRRGHAPDPLPSVRRAADQPGGLGRQSSAGQSRMNSDGRTPCG